MVDLVIHRRPPTRNQRRPVHRALTDLHRLEILASQADGKRDSQMAGPHVHRAADPCDAENSDLTHSGGQCGRRKQVSIEGQKRLRQRRVMGEGPKDMVLDLLSTG